MDTSSVILISAAKALGVDFSDLMMVGRQALWPRSEILQRIFDQFGVAENATALLGPPGYAERFFELMGAKRIESIDADRYENATRIHDMNTPIPEELRNRYSAVHDGGTIEHVFNVPQALKNCMQMVRVGGHFTQVNSANNMMGHGFWQLSPEMIFRAFTPENGFELQAVLLHEVTIGGRWFVVSDPAEVGSRVELVNNVPTYIMTIARRIREVPIFATFPQQSHYEVMWKTADQARPVHRRGLARRRKSVIRALTSILPKRVRQIGETMLIGDLRIPVGLREVREQDVIQGQFIELASAHNEGRAEGQHLSSTRVSQRNAGSAAATDRCLGLEKLVSSERTSSLPSAGE